MMKAVILAAGKGTRLQPYSKILPKALMPIAVSKEKVFITVIERLISQIVAAGITDVVVVVNYRADLIKEFLGAGASLGCKISYVFQDKLDGNAGAFYRCKQMIGKADALIADCDNYFFDDSAIKEMRQLHESSASDLSVAVAPVKEISKFAIIKTSEMTPLDIFEKPSDEKEWGNLAKSGLMMLSNKLASLDKKISLAGNGEYTTTQIVKYCISRKSEFKTTLFLLKKGFSDIGTWQEYISLLRKNL
jgi:dTDP-glucose pyrophosphorylase